MSPAGAGNRRKKALAREPKLYTLCGIVNTVTPTLCQNLSMKPRTPFTGPGAVGCFPVSALEATIVPEEPRRPAKRPRRRAGWLIPAGLLLAATVSSAQAQSSRVVIAAQPPYAVTWDGNNAGYSSPDPGARGPDNAASAADGVTTFASSSFLPGGIHDHLNINDGFYGNSSSWIADFAANPPDVERFVGVAFGKSVAVRSIAWSRDNTGAFPDRAVGTYTLQITRAASPETTPEGADPTTGWVTLGTVEYKAGADSAAFSAHLRHRFDIAAGGNPVAATGVRLKVSDAGICIDELEVNPPADPTPPLNNFLTITNAIGFTISWDRNDGLLSTESSPAPAPNNRALPNAGTTAFGSSELGDGVHRIANVNDGRYGDARSWIPNAAAPDPNPFIGLDFGASIELRNLAWGRDNGDSTDCCGGELTDRALGLYTLQITRLAKPGKDTAETGDATTGWVTVGQIHFRSSGGPFTAHKRHRFDLASTDGTPIVASGIRLKVPDSNTAIDEIEVNVRLAHEVDLSGNLTLTAAPGYSIGWDGNDGDFYSPLAGARTPTHDGLASNGARAFGSSELDFGVHYIRNVADGRYGNASSWISLIGSDQAPFVGIAFASPIEISVVAFGRDNGDTTEGGCGGTCGDRCLGLYTLQFTTASNPGLETAETGDAATGWETVGTIDYKLAAPPAFNPSLRHAFEVRKGDKPIVATAIRLLVSDGNTAIDEIEVNPQGTAVVPPLSDLLAITPAGGFGITWDRNDGEYSSTEKDAPARGHAGLQTRGGVAFGSSELDLGVHYIKNANDGIYGNTHSWIANFLDPADLHPFIGVRLPGLTAVRSIAWGRDNGDSTDCCGGTLTDRALGTYTLQLTHVAGADRETPETGDPATGWQTIGTIEYKAAFPNVFTPHLRHAFGVSQGSVPLLASAIRLKLSDNQLAIDELEVNPDPVMDQNVLAIFPEAGFTIAWDGNNGDYSSTTAPATAPENDALSTKGTTAIGSSELGLNTHFIANANDGLYGNSESWIADFLSGDADPWIGLAFGKSLAVSSVAWGRDNTGAFTDRAAGNYFLQYTQVATPAADATETGDPATGWAPMGQLQYRQTGTDAFRHHLRHEYRVALNGDPINATGIRLRVSNNQIAVDELEVNTVVPVPAAKAVLTVERQGTSLKISWTGAGTLESADAVTGGWTAVAGAATSPQTVPMTAESKFYRVRQ